MLIGHALLVPHLPTLVVDEHRRHRTEMLQALERASEQLLAEQPDQIVALSARWETPGPFMVDVGRRHGTITDYKRFGVEVRYDCAGNPALARALVEAGEKAGLHVGSATRGVDSGVSIPLHFLVPARDRPVVPLSVARRSAAECRQWGAVLRRTLSAHAERIAFVVGGLLTRNEHAWNLGREVPEGLELDRRVLDALACGEWDSLSMSIAGLAERAQPEADLRHLEILRGFLGSDAHGQLECYESSPGMGAALVEFPTGAEVVVPPGDVLPPEDEEKTS